MGVKLWGHTQPEKPALEIPSADSRVNLDPVGARSPPQGHTLNLCRKRPESVLSDQGWEDPSFLRRSGPG